MSLNKGTCQDCGLEGSLIEDDTEFCVTCNRIRKLEIQVTKLSFAVNELKHKEE